jgi:hypothetical protein
MATGAFSPTDASDLHRPATLWVDDKPAEIDTLRNMLTDHGVLVEIATSSAEAKAEVRKRPYDLMVVDFRLDGHEDGISFARYARQLMAIKYHRTIHFGAVTNFRHLYGEDSQREVFTFVYDKSDLWNGKSKAFLEDCLFAAADSRIRAEYPELRLNPPPVFLLRDSVEHVRCDVGYVLRLEGSQALVRLWRRSVPGERTIRVFDRCFLSERRVSEPGQPLRIDTFVTKQDKAYITLISPLHESTDRSPRRVAGEIDLQQFRGG